MDHHEKKPLRVLFAAMFLAVVLTPVLGLSYPLDTKPSEGSETANAIPSGPPHQSTRSEICPRFTLVDTVLLPKELRWAFDIRWAPNQTLVVAAGKRGVVEMSRTGEVLDTIIPCGGSPAKRGQDKKLWMATRIGVSDQLLVAAAPVFSLMFTWADNRRPVHREYAAVLDVDVNGDRALILGARQGPAGEWAPEGAMAWIDDGLEEPKPLHFLTAGPGSEVVSWYGIIDLGAGVMLSDGSSLVVPGVERGAFLYSAEGRLLHMWRSSELGIDVCHPLEEEAVLELQTDLSARFRYWNQHILVDDAVEWAGAPAILVRKPQVGGTGWDLVVLDPSGGSTVLEVPITSESGRTRARIDARDSTIAILLHESGFLDEEPTFRPRVVILEVEECE